MNISKINKPMLSGPLAATSHFISKHFSDPTPFQRSADENWKINCGRYGSQMPSGDALVAGVELLGPRQLRPFRDLQTARQKRKPLTCGHFGVGQVSVFNHCQSGNARPSGIDQNVPIRRRNWTEMATKRAAAVIC